MSVRPYLAACFLLALAGALPVRAAGPRAGVEEDSVPLLRVEGGGPTAQTTALAFSPDGHTLYAAGYDKVVRVWEWDETAGAFALQDRAYRVPIGPGTAGAVNCLAVSPDGTWLAATGLGVVRGEAGFREEGVVLPVAGTWDDEQLRDRGVIYLFRLRGGRPGAAPELRLLRGHRGVVLAMAFAAAGRDGGPVLVSAAREPRDDGRSLGRALVWDVNRPGPLAEFVVPEVASVKPPGLAVRHTGAGEKDLRVALAWRDGLLRAWDVAAAADRQPRSAPDGDAPWNGSAAFLPGPRLLTGGFASDRGGYLQSWDDPPGRRPVPGDRQPFAAPPYGHMLPRALCPVPSRDGVGHVAAVFQIQEKQSGREFYRLYLLTPDTLQPESRTFLWALAGGDPVLAVSPDGRFLAVAGPGTRAIRVYQTADLPREGRPQELGGAGTVFRRLAFARKGAAPELGLLLGTARADDLLFDFAHRRLTRDAAEKRLWSAAGPAGWSVRDLPGAAPADHELEWAHGKDTRRIPVRLEEGEEVTAYAVAPPLAGVTAAPTLAVATWKGQAGEPVLTLYEGRTGEPVRQLKGHTGRITALAVSPDGRFLASAAADETVCLWGLTDLNQVIGKHGTLTGAVLRPQGPGLLVERVEKGGPAADSLRAGDLITGLALRADDPKPRTGLSPLQFYLALWDVPPAPAPAGGVWLRVRRDGRERQVRVQVEQGVDDRKPLLSLFVAGGEGEPRWIAWTPFGPFDSSGQDAERYVGWHLNPSRPGQPARFAQIGQYRKQFYRPRLLPLLLASGDLPDVLRKLKGEVPRPVLHMVSVAERTQADPDSQFLVRARQVPLRFTIEGPSLAEGEVAAVTAAVDGKAGPSLPLGGVSGQELAATVELPGRGVYTVRVEARTAGDSPQTGSADVQIRYQPPPPVISLPDLPRDHTEVKEEDYTLRANVTPASGQTAKVLLLVNGKSVPVEAGTDIQTAVKLVHGPNTVRLTAVNEGALADHKASETATVERIIDYREPKAATVHFTEVEPQGGGRVKVGAAAVSVESGRLRLLATVAAPEGEKLTLVRLLRGTRAGERAVEEFREFEGGEFRLDRKVSLEEGPQDFVLLAKTEHKESRSAALHIEFRPPLPEVTVTAPQPETELVQGKDRSPGQVDVGVTWPLPDEFHAFEVVVRVLHDGKPVPQGAGRANEVVVRFPTAKEAAPFDEKAAVGGAAKSLATVRLAPGENRVEVQARSAWRAGPVIERAVNFRRPPFLLNVGAKSPVTRPSTTVEAVAETPSDLPLTAVRINDKRFEPEDVIAERKEDAKRGVTAFTIRVKNVILEAGLGDKALRLEVRNADGSAKETRRVLVKEAPKPAELQTRNLPAAVSQLPYELRFHVSSDSPLERVEVKQGDTSLLRLEVREKDRDGRFSAEPTVTLRHLESGLNRLVIEAENAGGLARLPVTLSYVPPPLRLVVDSPSSPEAGAITEVRGRLIWGSADQARDVDRKAGGIAVYVNDFLQSPPRLTPRAAGGMEQDFTVRAVLNGPRNRVRVECPGLPLEAGSVQEFTVACAAPERPSMLRLLIVNAAEPSIPADDLVRHALAALQLDRRGNQARSKVFREVVSYPRSAEGVGAVTGYVTQDRVLGQLRRIEDDIRRRGSPSDVVLIYWLGKDAVADRGDWYLPTIDGLLHGGEPKKTAVPLKRLLGAEERVPGGRVVLLDVAAAGGPGQGDQYNWSDGRAAVLRYAWSRKDVPLPALLYALERAAKGRQEVSVKDLAEAAADLLHLRFANSLKLTENLSHLAGLTLAGR